MPTKRQAVPAIPPIDDFLPMPDFFRKERARVREEQKRQTKYLKAGKKVVEAAERGGRRRPPGRDFAMAKKYVQRKPESRLSDTQLKMAIGKEYGLKRSAA